MPVGGFVRSAFLNLSTNAAVRAAATRFGPSVRASRRFIAGETLPEALAAVRTLNAEKKKATLDYLGENVSTPEEASAYARKSSEILAEIAREGLDCNISVKLTGMGLDLGEETAHRNLETVLAAARARGNFVRIDMEGSDYTQKTLDIFWRARERFDNVGIVIQAYLRRSADDIARIVAAGAPVRLCKGAYKEPPEIAFPDKRDVDANFKRLTEALLDPAAIARGARAAIATHDPEMIAHAKAVARARGVPPSAFEFQMLYGIRRDLQRAIVAEGYALRVYVPFGEAWYPYFMRRLAERPANVGFILKSVWKET